MIKNFFVYFELIRGILKRLKGKKNSNFKDENFSGRFLCKVCQIANCMEKKKKVWKIIIPKCAYYIALFIIYHGSHDGSLIALRLLNHPTIGTHHLNQNLPCHHGKIEHLK